MARYHHKPIAKAKLGRIGRDLFRISHRHPSDGPTVKAFHYHHGNAGVLGSDGKEELLFLHKGSILKGDVARLLNPLTPEILIELVEGYRLALDAGLIAAAPQSRAALHSGGRDE